MFESVDEVIDTRKRVSVLDHMRIYIVIILVRAERSILLWNKEEEGCLWEFRGKDLPFLEIFINERLQSFHFLQVE